MVVRLTTVFHKKVLVYSVDHQKRLIHCRTSYNKCEILPLLTELGLVFMQRLLCHYRSLFKMFARTELLNICTNLPWHLLRQDCVKGKPIFILSRVYSNKNTWKISFSAFAAILSSLAGSHDTPALTSLQRLQPIQQTSSKYFRIFVMFNDSSQKIINDSYISREI